MHIILTEGLERVDSGHVVALFVSEGWAVDVTRTGLDGASIDDDGRAIVARGRHENAWHVFVASGKSYEPTASSKKTKAIPGDGNISIVMLSLW